MKKVLFTISILVTSVILTSFAFSNQSFKENDAGKTWTYLTWVTGHACRYFVEPQTPTLYIYYRETMEGGRQYRCSLEKNDDNPPYLVRRNKYYKDKKNAFGNEYKYEFYAEGDWYFNANLPRMR